MKTRLGVMLLSIFLLSSVAHADARNKAKAQALMNEGNRLIGEGSYNEALEIFQSAYKEYPSRKILLNIGTMLLQLGRRAEAADTYEKYLMDPKAEKRREVKVKLGELNKKVARLSISVARSGAQILVDGRAVGKSPLKKAVRVDPGRRTVVAELDGEIFAGTTLSVSAGQRKAVILKAKEAKTIRPDKKIDKTEVKHTDTTTDTGETADRSDLVGVDASNRVESGGGLGMAGLITAGVGVVAVGLGVKFGFDAKSASDDVSKVTTWTQADTVRYNEGEAAERNMFISYGVGAAAIIGGGVMYMLGRKSSTEAEPGAVSVMPQMMPGGASVVVRGGF